MSHTHHHGARAKRILFGDNWNWLGNEPRWWRKLYKHRPQRRAAKQAERAARMGDDPLWPLDRKPHEYYW